MTDSVQPNTSGKRRPLRMILLILALLTSPLVCCGAIQLLDALPQSFLPSEIGFILNLFEAQARVENRTAETLYLTAITTTYGRPMVIAQNIAFRQRDIPLRPKGAVVLEYDSADLPLAGIVVCRTEEDCRLLSRNSSGAYQVDSYEDLASLEPGWLDAVKSHPLHTYNSVLIPALSLLPILLFSGWLYLGRLEKKRAG